MCLLPIYQFRYYDESLMVSQGVESQCWRLLARLVPRHGLHSLLGYSLGNYTILWRLLARLVPLHGLHSLLGYSLGKYNIL